MEHIELNRALWDERVPAHVDSPGYRVNDLIADKRAISDVVAFDRPLLGDITGLRGVHLQCHIGTDTISLARLGARMTGLDFSAPAIDAARELAHDCGAASEFVCAEFHDALDVLPRAAFDFVYTGIGAICWLPKISEWGRIVAELLAPGGRVFMREGHPMLWAIDERPSERGEALLPVEFHYFETEGGLEWTEEGTYVETDAQLVNNTSVSFNHGIGEIVTALLDAGMTVTGLTEHRSVPWEALPGSMKRDERGEWSLIERPERLPLSFTIQATKDSGPHT